MRADRYVDFALLYDRWQALYPRPFSLALAPRIEEAVRRRGVPAAVFADLACGTGTLAHWWARRHPSWRVYGNDLSPAMIVAARRPTSPVRRTPTPPRRMPVFLEQDLAETHLPEPAGLITCIFDSVNHITSVSVMRRVLDRVRRALLPGGLFVFDLLDESTFEETFSGYSISDGPDLYVGMEMSAERRGNVTFGLATFTFFFDGREGRGTGERRSSPGSGWRRLRFALRERCWHEAELGSMLTRSGLDVVEKRRISPDEDPDVYVPRTLWVCRRPS